MQVHGYLYEWIIKGILWWEECRAGDCRTKKWRPCIPVICNDMLKDRSGPCSEALSSTIDVVVTQKTGDPPADSPQMATLVGSPPNLLIWHWCQRTIMKGWQYKSPHVAVPTEERTVGRLFAGLSMCCRWKADYETHAAQHWEHHHHEHFGSIENRRLPIDTEWLQLQPLH